MFAARPDRGNWRATFGMEESEIRDLGVLNGSQRKPSEGFMVGKIHHRRLAVTNTLLPSALSCICCWQCLVVCCRYMYLILVTTSHIPNPNLISETTILPYPSSLSASPYPVPPYRADTPSRPPPNARPTAVEAHATPSLLQGLDSLSLSRYLLSWPTLAKHLHLLLPTMVSPTTKHGLIS
jgi:hypothetical protein